MTIIQFASAGALAVATSAVAGAPQGHPQHVQTAAAANDRSADLPDKPPSAPILTLSDVLVLASGDQPSVAA